jgi:hypothetical protein
VSKAPAPLWTAEDLWKAQELWIRENMCVYKGGLGKSLSSIAHVLYAA